MEHTRCPLSSRAGFMKVGSTGRVFFFFLAEEVLCHCCRLTVILQQRAAGCGNRKILRPQMQMSPWKHIDLCCEARDANGSALSILDQLTVRPCSLQ